jgi:ribosomal protein L32
MDWGARHLDGQAMTLTHKNCGATVMPHLACPECGEQVEARDMHAVRTDAALPKSA